MSAPVRTPLHRASEHGQLAVAALLLDRGADVNCRTNVSSDRLPALWCCDACVLAASVSCDMQFGQTLLHAACYSGHADVVRLLCRRGADVHAVDKVCCNLSCVCVCVCVYVCVCMCVCARAFCV